MDLEKEKMSKFSVALQKIEQYKNTFIPQANDLNKIVTLIEVLKKTWINEDDIHLVFAFSTRQAHYYGDALRFLTLVESFQYGGKITMMGLTEEAFKAFEKGSVKKNLQKWIISKELIEVYEERILKSDDINSETQKRRKNSLESWRRWIHE